jgi:two-component system, NarL family, invasion response regulator UvrY
VYPDAVVGTSIRILIADDHKLVRQGLTRILSAEPDFQVVAEAGDCSATLQMVDAHPADILLLDLTMPGRGGVEVLREVRDKHPDLKVLVLTMHAEEQFAVRVMRAGAAGFLTKDAAGDQLVQAIHAVRARGKYVSPTVAEQLARDVDGSTRRVRREELSDRERQVLLGIAAGQSLTAIAQSMSLSVKTVSTYRTRLLRKLDLHSNADLVKFAIETGLTA